MSDDKEKKIKLLNDVLASHDFVSSNTYKKLLTYLVNASFENRSPKELSIAIDVFKKDLNFNPGEDSTVRAYISNLRKKLDNYYRNEGSENQIRITIPKGGYEVIFLSSNDKKKIKSSNIFAINKYIIINSTLILFLYLITIFNLEHIPFWADTESLTDNEIWDDFISSENQKLVVLGNDLFFIEKTKTSLKIAREHNVNSKVELDIYQNNNPSKIITEVTPYAFYPKMSISTLPLFYSKLLHNMEHTTKHSYEVEPKDLLEKDILFIGAFRNLYFSEYIFKDNKISFSTKVGNKYIKIAVGDSVKTLQRIGKPKSENTDYCLFRKMPGPNNNTIYLFSTFYESGISAAVKYMLDENSLTELEDKLTEKYDEVPKYFDVIFKVTGHSRTAFNTSIEHLSKISSDKSVFW
ncbi:MAG: helix-turn-helix domain-containing protein [Melioribacteraceae bacterium]|nr:helix-turn-helix domain-containing protein [Melioribacteraceae bacterium]